MLSTSITLFAQVKLPVFADSLFPTYYHQRLSFFNAMPQTKNEIIFLGNSLTDGAEWAELFNDLTIKNRGISGDVVAGVLHRLPQIVKQKPQKIFLLIGTNDLARGISKDSLLKYLLLLADYIKQETPVTQLFIQSILPVNKKFGKFGGHTSNGDAIRWVNAQLQLAASKHHFTFISLHDSFTDASGNLNERFTNDGLHLKGEAYLVWKHLVYPYVYGLQPKPSIIPKPQQLNFFGKDFSLFSCSGIVINDTSLLKLAKGLQNNLQEMGIPLSIENNKLRKQNAIHLKLGKVATAQSKEEAYQLDVNENGIMLTANSTHGIFNGLQTLRQLMRDGMFVDGCEILDFPAFSWRGYMIDVGRNYMSMDLLKQQIDVMTQYKLNVFHFHATEDIAWRFESKLYPALNAPENMLRNKGSYYTVENIKELIAYCQERFITFVPEIDMPGHSAAFTRALKTDMQSDSGMVLVKNLLKEFFKTYEVKYLHIGADEVKIHNKTFVPEMTSYIESFGIKTIGWQPGGNFLKSTLRQLWMDDNGHLADDSSIQFIDSRHLYLNHMDPLEAVTTLFFRQIGDREKEDKNIIGGTICTWPDRRVEEQMDVFKMNPVYGGMLTFAERSWRGGGNKGWQANIGEPPSDDVKDFTEFENRLLDNKQQFFKELIFPYAKQSKLIWNLYGPFKNEGNVFKKFEKEEKNIYQEEIKPDLKQVGATVIMRHWWAPLISGALPQPKENTTWYATTKIWSDEAGIKNFWVGFNNLSRSPATDSPPLNAWDEKGSAVWVNQKIIEPPHWARAAQKGNAEIPLIDEGYEYRVPTKIFLNKGWNTILIKCPVRSFKGKDWQNPVKWMFTFVEAAEQ